MNTTKLKLAVCADVHREIMHDAEERLSAFVKTAESKGADFIVCLGDFCHSKEEHRGFLDIWNSFPGEKHLVLGNHDTDASDKLTLMRFWGVDRFYYSFDCGPFHFCVLDTNTVTKDGVDYDYGNANYFAFAPYRENLSQSQVRWLRADLDATDKPTILFSHASLYNVECGIRNREQVHGVLTEANRKAGFQKVVASLNGHNHVDSHLAVDGIHYIDINSAANSWLGEDYSHETYGAAIDEAYPYIRFTSPYQSGLFTMVELDAAARTMVIEGAESGFVGKTPQELGHSGFSSGFEITPRITHREITF